MEAERWQKIERLYHLALEQEKSQRPAFLERACNEDESLRSEVESLLAQGEENASFLETPALELAAEALARDQARAEGGAKPTAPMIGATISPPRAPGRVDYADIPNVPTTRADTFHGTERFEIRRRLGSGGFGVVYEAYDREHDAIVALKTLQQLRAEALYRFKHEFRALADIAHPNLITLYELSAADEHWFFTMELVEGVNFLSYVLPQAQHAHLVPRPDMNRLRGAFRQLSEGVRALHQAGKLHCDLKPSNVLVDGAGRVVILDFGLVTESDAVAMAEDYFQAGTPEYMSPEQASGLAPSPASDWYSVGVMLFEALTGQQPFRGSVREILEHKRWRDPPAPLDLVSGLPADLDDLCGRLLSRDPQCRPGEEEVLRCLGSDRAGIGEASSALNSVSRSPFIGRERQLSILREALESSRKGQMVTVWVHGHSGVGKTALVQRFLDEVRQTSNIVVLEGRCYEREVVPYNALDSIIDNLDRYMRSLPRVEAQALMPLDLAALTRLFPILQEWRALCGASTKVADAPDLKELRRRGFAALRQVLDAVAVRTSVVLFIDDLQWGDEDSADLLADLIKRGTTALLFVAGYRTDEADSSPLLRRLTSLRTGLGGTLLSVELALEELDPPQAAELASGLLVEGRSSAKAQAQSIAREAQGNPFFIGELVRYAQMRAELQADPEEFSAQVAGTQTGMAEPSLNDVIRARLSRLSESTRRLLEVVAVAGQPVDLHLAKRAARISSGGHTEIHQLRAAHLVRTRKTEGAEQVEAYHDRIREVAEASLDPELLKQHHHQLATQWEASIQAAPRVLAIHFRGAGIHDKALQYAAEAAQQAEAALAFGGAIEFYRFALEALFNLPQSPERDNRELVLRQSIFMPLFLTRGSYAPETIDARERLAGFASKCGDQAQLVLSVLVKGHNALEVGDLSAGDAFAEQALELALQEGGPTLIGLAHLLQMIARSARGDLAGVEKHFIAGLKFFIEPGFRQVIGRQDLYAFGTAILNAWTLGRSDVARERVAQMMAAANGNNPYEVAFSGFWAAALRLLLKEYEQAEALAAAALELSEKHQFQLLAANSGCILGAARAHLGRTTEGIALIRQGIARLLEAHAKISSCTVFLAVAQERAGNIADALATVEQALQANPEELMNRTGALMLRGELRLKQGQTELAETDFREAIEVARNMDAKAPELQITMSLAQLLDKQGRRAEARTILADIYGWFTEGFDTADLKDAKALLDEMGH